MATAMPECGWRQQRKVLMMSAKATSDVQGGLDGLRQRGDGGVDGSRPNSFKIYIRQQNKATLTTFASTHLDTLRSTSKWGSRDSSNESHRFYDWDPHTLSSWKMCERKLHTLLTMIMIQVAMCNFPTIKDAADVAIATMSSGIQVSRVELLDEVQVRAVNLANGKNLPEVPTLMFEFVGTEAYSREQTLIVQKIASEHNGSDFVFAEDPEAKKELWKEGGTLGLLCYGTKI
ncbi:hypothetical protein RJ640_027091 [Escallonia rubra]|uniref:FAD-binding oxidoreductase/transferase type 4 C-terminal domain-containing protein n=1 Tax=Escallonia rubra TaxID=112253 RepID=A0AA88QWG6_9ASTE|nr:hypothetical protein RJ640_027091 [Escallonia rubra]